MTYLERGGGEILNLKIIQIFRLFSAFILKESKKQGKHFCPFRFFSFGKG